MNKETFLQGANRDPISLEMSKEDAIWFDFLDNFRIMLEDARQHLRESHGFEGIPFAVVLPAADFKSCRISVACPKFDSGVDGGKAAAGAIIQELKNWPK